MSILSYAFGDSVIYSTEGKASDRDRKMIYGRNIEYYAYNLAKEIKKYTQIYREDVVKFLNNIPGVRYLYLSMLVAAYSWYMGNNQPEIFTPDLFSENNNSFLLIKRVSFPDMEWKREHTLSLLTYANIIRKYSRNIPEVSGKDQTDYFKYNADVNESEDDEDYSDDEDDVDDD